MADPLRGGLFAVTAVARGGCASTRPLTPHPCFPHFTLPLLRHLPNRSAHLISPNGGSLPLDPAFVPSIIPSLKSGIRPHSALGALTSSGSFHAALRYSPPPPSPAHALALAPSALHLPRSVAHALLNAQLHPASFPTAVHACALLRRLSADACSLQRLNRFRFPPRMTCLSSTQAASAPPSPSTTGTTPSTLAA